MEKHHINTGCYYTKEGQEITILNDPDNVKGPLTHFIDHSRGVSGTIKGTCNSNQIFFRAYLRNDYKHLEMDFTERNRIEEEYASGLFTFIDVSTQYKQFISH